ncbi:multiple sugar transport system permease protein/sn-glycerol 3-phosphate transport system permease protein [Virgibacillus natechei]|uniref:Multiple sugar transport system permease protein/sn-glycerol 3-phosphate transport system permease protein n=1 Tax=Virgibacillus natechei TaxID=1216297 RepID=A0ABS4IGB4_9BACI|nr:sugar ABC transporter permease [Virgibacillus natechei]MBP1969366.1 multiple sugar transport system permease protein/sn-glycerol 3-phosphate transport system permease protein [Virgibacillus natechei]UZD12511.1 sugar ABC transporter permease [Virgibacillus natechei]
MKRGSQVVTKPNKTAHHREKKLFGTGILYLLPALILLGVFLFYPIFRTLYFSFFELSGGGVVEGFIGWAHYADLIQSSEFRKSMVATLLFVLYTVPAEIIIALFLALLANEKLRGIGFFRTIFASTLGVSIAAGASIFLFLFHPSLGVLNNMLEVFGINGVDWLTNSRWALVSVAITTVWMHLGINFIILLGGLQNISRELYESADIDGAGYWSKLFKITIPLLSPVLFFVLIIAVIGSFQTFGQIDLLTGGGPAGATNIIVYSIYQEAFSYGNFGYASAQAIILFLIILIVTIFQFKYGEKKVHYQ